MNSPINGDWSSFAPPQDLQYSIPTKVDADDCAEEAPVHALGFLTGFWGSPRGIAWYVKPSQTTGSSPFEAVSAITAHGLIPYKLWPNPPSFTLAEYYSDPPQSVLDFQIPTICSLVAPDLSKSPSIIRLLFPNGVAHFGVKVNATSYFDSEPGNEFKPLNYGGAVVTSEMGIETSDSFFLKSSGFTPEQFANLPANIQAAVKENDNGAKNIIFNGQVITQ